MNDEINDSNIEMMFNDYTGNIINQFLDEDYDIPFSIIKVTESYIIVEDMSEPVQYTTINVADDNDLELRLLVAALVTEKYYEGASLVLSAKDVTNEIGKVLGSTNDRAEVMAFTTYDKSGNKIATFGDDDLCEYDSDPILINDLLNELRINGIIVDPSLQLDKNESDKESFIPIETKMKMKKEANTVTDIARRMKREKLKGKTRKKAYLRSRRRKTPQGRKRSRAMKLSWKKTRGKRIRGMHKFNRSARGKKVRKLVGKARAKVY